MIRFVLCLFFLLPASQMGFGRQQSSNASSTLPMGNFINPDGSLQVPHNFSGSLDPKGWRLHLAPNGAPRFTPSSGADPADTAWDDRFCLVSPNGVLSAIAVSGTDVYLAGAFTRIGPDTVFNVIKWNGRSWSMIDTSMDGWVFAISITGNDLYIGGSFTTVNGVSVNHVAKWDGSTWSALGSGTSDVVYAIGVLGTDVYAGGAFLFAGGTFVSYIAKWDGSTWSALGSGFNNQVATIAVQDTFVYAGGYFTQTGPDTLDYVARWDGSSWSPLSLGVDAPVLALAVHGSDIYAGGQFTGYRHRIIVTGAIIVLAARSVAKWNGGWSALGSGTNYVVQALAARDTTLYVAGQFDSAGGIPAKNVAKWDGSTWSALGSGIRGGSVPVVLALAVSGTDLYAAGQFKVAGEDSAFNAAKWDGTGWAPLGLGLNGAIFALASIGNDLYAGGSFTTAGGVIAKHVARWDGSNWYPLGSGTNNTVRALTVSGGDLIAGGSFDTAGGIRANYIARWDGSTWSSIGTGMDNFVVALSAYGTDLYAGGFFNNASGTPAKGIARWDGFGWSSLGAGFGGDNYVQSLLARPNGSGGTNVYAGGQFDSAGGVPANYVAFWNGGHWAALDSGLNSNVFALISSGNDVYAGGYFYFAGSQLVYHIARWNGSKWSPLGSGMGDDGVFSLAVNGKDVYAAGTFDAFGNSYPHDVARWDGSDWQPLGSGTIGWSGPTYALAMSGNSLYLGGFIKKAGGKQSLYFARWSVAPPPLPVDLSLRSGWNLVSAPVAPADDSVAFLFPGASGNAFDYGPGGYEVSQTVAPGVGYWIKYPSASADSISGTALSVDTVAVSTGWNLIGSISKPISVTSIASVPPGMITGSIFGYDGGYTVADSIRPGSGYWVKVNADGKLILSSSGAASPATRIRIVPTSDLPPPPPDLSGNPNPTSHIPRRFSLEQNYPNPFNPSTQITFELPEQAVATLKIYDIVGREVSVLVNNQRLDAGTYHRQFGPKSAGTDLASGVYIYRLDATSTATPGRRYSQVRKMLLVR